MILDAGFEMTELIKRCGETYEGTYVPLTN